MSPKVSVWVVGLLRSENRLLLCAQTSKPRQKRLNVQQLRFEGLKRRSLALKTPHFHTRKHT